jgi:hypothetical protein
MAAVWPRTTVSGARVASLSVDVQETAARPRSLRWERPVAVVFVVVAVFMAGIELLGIVRVWDVAQITIASEYRTLTEATTRWLAGGPFYQPEQLAGPYGWQGDWILYPPPMLLLFVPLSLLPPPVWWIAPIGVTAWAIYRLRPRPLALGVIALCLANPTTISMVIWGNPAMLFVAALSLGVLYGWPAVVIFLKPTLAPFALFGSWRRSWWIALAAGIALSLAFLPMWIDYVAVVQNGIGARGLAYSLAQVPVMLIPIAAWLGRRQVGLAGPFQLSSEPAGGTHQSGDAEHAAYRVTFTAGS